MSTHPVKAQQKQKSKTKQNEGRPLTSHGCDPYVASDPPTTLREGTIGLLTWGTPHFEPDKEEENLSHLSHSFCWVASPCLYTNINESQVMFGVYLITHLTEQHRCQCLPKNRERAERQWSSSLTHTSRLGSTGKTKWFIDLCVCAHVCVRIYSLKSQ